jgi:hypothetical protein
MVTLDELMRHRNGSRRRFNIIGFTDYSTRKPTKSCVIDHAVLIPRRNLDTGEDMPGLMCPRCGMSYTESEAPTEERIKGKFSGKQETRIISAKNRNKRYYDKYGNEINDPDLIEDIQRGMTVISYQEEKQGRDTIIDTRNRRVIRSIQREK